MLSVNGKSCVCLCAYREDWPTFVRDLLRMGASEGSSSSWTFCKRTGEPNCTAFSRIRKKSGICRSITFKPWERERQRETRRELEGHTEDKIMTSTKKKQSKGSRENKYDSNVINGHRKKENGMWKRWRRAGGGRKGFGSVILLLFVNVNV